MAQFIGIDVGTTAVKAAVMDHTGVVHAQFAQSYPTQRHPGQIAEQDPDDWVRLVRQALDRFAAYDVTAIGLCSQVNTHVFVGADGHALAPAILWQDGRARGQAAQLDARVTPAQKQAWWGAPMPIDASHAMSRMAWMAENRPEIWDKTQYVMLPKDYVMLALTGEASTDPVSNIGLVDSDLAYIPEVLALVGGAADRVAPLVGITDIAGYAGGVPVVSGTMDAWAGLVGTGGAKERSTVYLSGTSEIMGISSQSIVPTQGAIVFPKVAGIRLHAAPTQNGGDAKKWFADAQGLSLDAMARMVAGNGRSSATPLFLPQLEGERAPLWDADLRGAFLGITRRTTQADFARAVYEGVAFAARHALDTLKASADVDSDVIACGGGGFRSAAWSQIRADVLNRPLRVLAAGESGVAGAVMLAAIGAGVFDGFEEAGAALTRYGATYQPDTAKSAGYDAVFAIYKDAIAANAAIGKRLTDAGSHV